MSVCPTTFRSTLGTFPTGVAVVTTQNPQGEPVGLTITSFTSLSLDPPQVLFCLSNASSTQPLFTPGRHFAVNILSAQQRELALHFAHCNENRVPTNWRTLPSHQHEDSGCRLLSEATSHVVCQVAACYEGGDHTIIVGNVIDLIRKEDPPTPLVRHISTYKVLKDS